MDWIRLNLPPTVSFVEIVWTLPNLAWLVRYVLRARVSMQALGLAYVDGAPEQDLLAAHMRAVRFLGTTLVFECWVGVGLIAMMMPNQPNNDYEAVGLLLTTTLLVLSAMILGLLGEAADLYQRQLVRSGKVSSRPRSARTRSTDRQHAGPR